MSPEEQVKQKAVAFKRHIDEDDAPHDSIRAGSRCGLETSTFQAWFSGFSPRNGSFASVEGPWEDWVGLAKEILEIDEAMKALGYEGPK